MNIHTITISSENQGQVIALPLDVAKVEVVFEQDAQANISYKVPKGVSADQEIQLIFKGDRSSGEFTGIIEADGSSVKVNLIISHIGEDTDCLAQFRGVGAGSAIIDCRGMIRISPGATGTDTLYRADFLKSHGSPKIMAIPALEIQESNIIQASHGVTVGKMDENQIYYMESRGMRMEDARELLLDNFLRRQSTINN